MKNQRLFAHVFGAVSAIGLMSSSAFATDCYNGVSINATTGAVTNQVSFPAASSNTSLNVNCGRGSAGTFTISGTGTGLTNAVGNKSVQCNKISGTGTIRVEGLDAAGARVCTITDGSADGTASAITACPASAVRFRVTANY